MFLINKTRNKDWIGGVESTFTCLGATNHSNEIRPDEDFYATDPFAMELLLEKETFSHKIWEPACGAGHLSGVLKDHGYDVRSTDLIFRGYGEPETLDFLKLKNVQFDGDIITNPPYKFALEFVEKALEIVMDGHKVAMFLKIQFLEGKKRRDFYKNNPPKIVYISSSRLNCARNGDFGTYPHTSAVCYSWFVWEKGFKGDPIIKWIN